MKKLLLSLLISGMISSVAFAQETKEAKEAKPDKVEWEKKIRTELNLTQEQTVKYDALNKEYSEKIDLLMKDASLAKEVQKEKKMALKKEKEVKLFEFLTAEQQVKYKEIMDKKKAGKPSGS
jgi:Na+-transporting NADH:ubiquinone oxidoreductase subunit NqrC